MKQYRDTLNERDRYVDGCSDCGWTGDFQVEDKCPECGGIGSMLRCRDIELDGDVRSAAFRYDAFNEGVAWASISNRIRRAFLRLIGRGTEEAS